MLRNKGISAEVLHVPVVKPFLAAGDVIESAKKTGVVITVENHSIIGGLGSAISEVLTENYPKKLIRLGLKDAFGTSGSADELMEYFEITSKFIVRKFI